MPQKEDVESAVAATLQALSTGRPLDLATLQMLANDASADTLAFCKGTLVATLPDRLHLDSWVGAGAPTRATSPPSPPRSAIAQKPSTRRSPTLARSRCSRPRRRKSGFRPSPRAPANVGIERRGAGDRARAHGARGQSVAAAARHRLRGVRAGLGDYARRTALAAGFGQLDPLMPAAAAATDLVVRRRAPFARRGSTRVR